MSETATQAGAAARLDAAEVREELDRIGEAAVAQVGRWLRRTEDSGAAPHASAQRLAAVLSHPRGLEFTVGFVDRVIRTEDNKAAAEALAELGQIAPDGLGFADRAQIKAGAMAARTLPGVVVPAARARMRSMVGHMVIDARDKPFGKAVKGITESGHRLNINLLGEAVLGEAEADHHLEDTRRLLRRDDVDYVSIKVSSVASQISMWGFDATVDYVVERLVPLYREAAATSGDPTFINLDMEEYRDLHLTIAVFTALLSREEFKTLEAGIVLQAYLPDALGAMQQLSAFAAERVRNGGADIKVRLVKGANLAVEKAHAEVAGWPVVTCESKQASDANYKLVLHWLFTQERMAGLRLGVAGHNLFDIAFAHLLGDERGVSHRLEFEMLQGMAADQAEAVSADVGRLLLYVPAVRPQEFDVAISYLVRRLEENSANENFMSGIFELGPDGPIFEREADRFRNSLGSLREVLEHSGHLAPSPQHEQERAAEAQLPLREYDDGLPEFANEPDTDPALPANQEWGKAVMDQAMTPGWLESCALPQTLRRDDVDALVASSRQAAREWADRPAAERARILYRAADILAARRGHLLAVAAAEVGKSLAQSDPEVSEAIDFARYYAHSALSLHDDELAEFVPDKLVLITPPWNFPLAIPAGGTFAALAAGAAVIHKPSKPTPHCSMAILEALWEAGVPREVLHGVYPDEGEAGKRLVSHEGVDRVILTGASETAAMFSSWRDDLQINAETSGKNALVVTPSADRDLAVADLVASAFGHAGQKCSAASLGILVGSVYSSERFRRQLVDAASSMVVDWPQNLSATVGPLTEQPSDKLMRALTTLEGGESWLLKPRQLDDTGRLWSPGIKDGVRPGSFFHLTECFGPVLGLMKADDLDEALNLQNAVDYGLTGGIHSLEPREVRQWLDGVEVGNAYVNRGITGAIVRRQSFGGWKKSSVGLGSKAGGPNYVMLFGQWRDAAASRTSQQVPQSASSQPPSSRAASSQDTSSPVTSSHGTSSRAATSRADWGIPGAEALLSALRSDAVVTEAEQGWIAQALDDDQRWWDEEFGVGKDHTALQAEANVFRYLPEEVLVRVNSEASAGAVVRALLAAVRAGSRLRVSLEGPATAPAAQAARAIAERFGAEMLPASSDADFSRQLGSGEFSDATGLRVRMIGSASAQLRHAVAGRPEIAILDDEVTASGRVELRYWLKEQAVSMTLHRFGTPSQPFHELAKELRGDVRSS